MALVLGPKILLGPKPPKPPTGLYLALFFSTSIEAVAVEIAQALHNFNNDMWSLTSICTMATLTAKHNIEGAIVAEVNELRRSLGRTMDMFRHVLFMSPAYYDKEHDRDAALRFPHDIENPESIYLSESFHEVLRFIAYGLFERFEYLSKKFSKISPEQDQRRVRLQKLVDAYIAREEKGAEEERAREKSVFKSILNTWYPLEKRYTPGDKEYNLKLTVERFNTVATSIEVFRRCTDHLMIHFQKLSQVTIKDLQEVNMAHRDMRALYSDRQVSARLLRSLVDPSKDAYAYFLVRVDESFPDHIKPGQDFDKEANRGELFRKGWLK